MYIHYLHRVQSRHFPEEEGVEEGVIYILTLFCEIMTISRHDIASFTYRSTCISSCDIMQLTIHCNNTLMKCYFCTIKTSPVVKSRFLQVLSIQFYMLRTWF